MGKRPHAAPLWRLALAFSSPTCFSASPQPLLLPLDKDFDQAVSVECGVTDLGGHQRPPRPVAHPHGLVERQTKRLLYQIRQPVLEAAPCSTLPSTAAAAATSTAAAAAATSTAAAATSTAAAAATSSSSAADIGIDRRGSRLE